jgi:hypothetical protein
MCISPDFVEFHRSTNDFIASAISSAFGRFHPHPVRISSDFVGFHSKNSPAELADRGVFILFAGFL